MKQEGIKPTMRCVNNLYLISEHKQVKIKLHPKKMSKDNFNLDIGLIKLDNKVFFGPDISPICLKVLSEDI